jgi:hypothetical protein
MTAKKQTRYPDIIMMELEVTYDSLKNRSNPEGKGTETIYFVYSGKKKGRVFVNYADREETQFEEAGLHPADHPWTWPRVQNAAISRLSEEKVRELMKDRGLAKKLL